MPKVFVPKLREVNMSDKEEQEPIMVLAKDQYFYINNTAEHEYYTLRALKDFQIDERGPDAWTLAHSLQEDGCAIIIDPDIMDGIDFAFHY
jgi:hypothetical protein